MSFEDYMIEDGYSDEESYFDHLVSDYLDNYEQEPEEDYYDDEPYDEKEAQAFIDKIAQEAVKRLPTF